METQKGEILDQFTKQAAPFANASAISDKQALEILLGSTNASEKDTTLDVACGPGIVVCAFAEVVRHATGIDIVPTMIEQARLLQKINSLTNVSWKIGDVTTLPYADASFSIVTSRYAFHHLENPVRVLSEMKRVCRNDGKIVLIDVVVSEDSQKAGRFNRMEKLRDPSHVRALSLSEMKSLFKDAGLPDPEISYFNLELELESFLNRSFPTAENAAKVRKIIEKETHENKMGINVRRDGNTFEFTYPIAVLTADIFL